MGDVDCDNLVTSIDAALVLQVEAGLVPTLPCQGAADANLDGSIDTAIFQFVADLIGAWAVSKSAKVRIGARSRPVVRPKEREPAVH